MCGVSACEVTPSTLVLSGKRCRFPEGALQRENAERMRELLTKRCRFPEGALQQQATLCGSESLLSMPALLKPGTREGNFLCVKKHHIS